MQTLNANGIYPYIHTTTFAESENTVNVLKETTLQQNCYPKLPTTHIFASHACVIVLYGKGQKLILNLSMPILMKSAGDSDYVYMICMHAKGKLFGNL